MIIDSGTTSDVFIEHKLITHLREGDYVIMDNISVHKNTGVKEHIESTGSTIKFLPPYSPDLNPIEKLWSKLNHSLGRMETSTRNIFDASIVEAIKLVKTEDLRTWIIDAG